MTSERTTLAELGAQTVRPVAQSPTRRPSVSVVIPCYNYGRFVGEAIGSALDQRDVEVEVIVVDDASSDDSVEVAASFGDRVRVVRHERNTGPVQTFNDGLAVATGDHLVRLDADDLLTPGSLARAAALLEAFPSVGMVYGHPIHFEGSPGRHRGRATAWRVLGGGGWLDLRCELGVNCITSPEVVMRRSVVERVGGQRPLAHAHDMEMWMRIARAADVGWIEGADQAWHREHASSLSVTQNDVMGDLAERSLAFETLLTDDLGDPAADGARLAIASRALADEALRRATAAYARGRGGTPETDGYLAFVDGLDVDRSTLPTGRVFARAERLGPVRARRSPALLAWAVGNRLRARAARRRWHRTGL